MIEEGNEQMKNFYVILGAALFIGGFVILLLLFSSVDDAVKVTSVLAGVGSIIGLLFAKSKQ